MLFRSHQNLKRKPYCNKCSKVFKKDPHEEERKAKFTTRTPRSTPPLLSAHPSPSPMTTAPAEHTPASGPLHLPFPPPKRPSCSQACARLLGALHMRHTLQQGPLTSYVGLQPRAPPVGFGPSFCSVFLHGINQLHMTVS